MNARLLYEDARRVVRGVRRLIGHLTSSETVDLGLGEFSAEGRTVVPGRPHRYAARLASARPGPATVMLRIDIVAVGAPPSGPTDYASFGRYFVVPGGAMTVTIEYDWLDSAAFILGGHRLAPDDFHRNPSAPEDATMFAMTARLRAGPGSELDALTIYQASSR